jgi:leucyl aminopeptidase
MPESQKPSAHFSGSASPIDQADVDLLFVPLFQRDETSQDLAGLDEATGGEMSRAIGSGEFSAKPYEVLVTPVRGKGYKARRIGLVGAGKRADATPERLRRIAATCGYAARKRSVKSVGFVVRAGLDVRVAVQAAADGLSAAEFDGATYKRRDEDDGRYPGQWIVVAPGAEPSLLRDAVAHGRTIGESANAARELANEPANVLTPRVFADRVAAMSSAVGLEVEVLNEDEIRALKMGLLLGVAQGSVEPPRLIVIRHEPAGAPASPVLALVGKGITFDTGGISIKPADGMERMKDDMAGGAAVAAAMRALALLKAPFRVMAVIPTTENMPGGRATRPGDVLTSANGKTVEVINTDAEGRLILGDALWYAQRQGATHLVDVATLTGACVVALGRVASGLFGSPDAWVETVRAAATRAGDRVWALPVFDDYREQLRSEIADMVNSAGRPAGAITAACFLKEFVEDRPWAHLDIAGTAWAEERKPYQPKGATGVAVRVLTELGMTVGQDRARAD